LDQQIEDAYDRLASLSVWKKIHHRRQHFLEWKPAAARHTCDHDGLQLFLVQLVAIALRDLPLPVSLRF
jgi:hypothetical protein